MNNAIFKIKQYFNKLHARYLKAEIFLENPDIPMEEKLKYVKDFQMLINHMQGTFNKLKDMGANVTNYNLLNGFEEVRDHARKSS